MLNWKEDLRLFSLPFVVLGVAVWLMLALPVAVVLTLVENE